MRYPLLSIPCQLGPCSDYRFNHRPQLGPNDRNKYPVKFNSRTLEGYRKSQGWANDQRVYFIIEFSQDCEVLAGYKKFSPLENGQKITDKGCYLYVDFGQKTNKILAKISISSANTEGAIANLEKELSHWSFDKVKRDANHAWKRQLQKIKAEGRNEADLENFYTAL